MAPKRATFFSYGSDDTCRETKQFIEEAGVVLECRDIGKNPLTLEELDRLVGTLSVEHFLNTLSEAYTKYGLDRNPPDRARAITLMAQDYTLIRRPIVKSARLLTIGCDKKRISEMLQINPNGHEPLEDNADRRAAGVKNHSRSGNKVTH